MADWRKRAKITDDVIYFPYISETAAFQAREVFLWDVDKTYLDTKFETVRGLIRTATEKATQKKNIPGSAELVTSLKDAWVTRSANPFFPIFFITASPPQMEKKINQKLALDGINPFGIFCKDNLPNLRPRRFWRLNKQVGFKLQALLQMRALLREDVRLVMFGDDGEADAVIYSLFSDICARRLDTSELRKILNAFFVLDTQVDKIFQLQATLSQHDPVEKIYINLADDTDSDYYLKFGRRTVPTSNNLQVAFDLFQDKRLELEHVAIIAQQMIQKFHFTIEEIDASLDDLIRRDKVAVETCGELIPYLQKENCLSPDFQPSVKPKTVVERSGHTVTKLDGSFDPWVPEHVDYLHDYR